MGDMSEGGQKVNKTNPLTQICNYSWTRDRGPELTLACLCVLRDYRSWGCPSFPNTSVSMSAYEQQRERKELADQHASQRFSFLLFPVTLVLERPLCYSEANQAASPGSVPWSGHGLCPLWSWFQEGNDLERSSDPVLWWSKHTSQDVKKPTCSKSFCFLPGTWKGSLVLSEWWECSLSWYEVKALYIILLSVQNELSPPRLLHRSLTVLLSIRGTHPEARTVHQRPNEQRNVEESHSKMKDVSWCRVRWWKNKKPDKYVHKCRKGTSSPTPCTT